ncbi:MAG TPA: exodeoxyribonuclease III [Cryomorphaceae bacterium]|nr:exodeoxyribonuclease III [Owenweeksia sp.]HAD96161.1 exodeoxyribonuclease III [Cryomorphaceae bacterium]|tara:strand:- start:792 stop:1553 length:762 start_codon:yes stop_codon:yes gene_type:complete
MKIISYNVNGIRAAQRKGLTEWLAAAEPDIIGLQETKAQPDQIDVSELEAMGYQTFIHSAEKKGYSGVAIFTKVRPENVVMGCGIDYIDREGRVIRADFGDFSFMSVYFPSGSSGDHRQEFKMQFLADFQKYINELKKEHPKLIIGGDYNICHRAIDIHDPVRNATSSGFLPEEREWVSGFLESGFIDTFRVFNQNPHNYSWWSYRANARANNKGWRIDYNMASEPMRNRLKRAAILPEAKHSDHCPVLLEIG